MKLISFTRLGKSGFGAMSGRGIIDLTGRLAPHINSIKDAITADAMNAAAAYIADRPPELALTDIDLLPVIPDAGKILCIGLNYKKHQLETGRPDAEYPTVFARYADSQVAHGQPLVRPSLSERFDYEAELAIVIGKGGRAIPEESAMDHIAGYSCYNDGSIRDWQRHTSQFTPGKTFPGTGGFGPYLVTPDEVGDHTELPIECRLNGEVMQQATLADLLFPLPTLINYCSTFTPLSAGDVIVTGTPGGIGDKRQPPVYLRPGDVVEVDLGKVGTLVNPVVAETFL
jgi:2-keto-4-pentenoate hydratase/2-oxohepta-3-ene-1,7-dioic acid hydratase in catechol pathway